MQFMKSMAEEYFWRWGNINLLLHKLIEKISYRELKGNEHVISKRCS